MQFVEELASLLKCASADRHRVMPMAHSNNGTFIMHVRVREDLSCGTSIQLSFSHSRVLLGRCSLCLAIIFCAPYVRTFCFWASARTGVLAYIAKVHLTFSIFSYHAVENNVHSSVHTHTCLLACGCYSGAHRLVPSRLSSSIHELTDCQCWPGWNCIVVLLLLRCEQYLFECSVFEQPFRFLARTVQDKPN